MGYWYYLPDNFNKISLPVYVCYISQYAEIGECWLIFCDAATNIDESHSKFFNVFIGWIYTYDVTLYGVHLLFTYPIAKTWCTFCEL